MVVALVSNARLSRIGWGAPQELVQLVLGPTPLPLLSGTPRRARRCLRRAR